MRDKELKKFDLFGVNISAINMEYILESVENSILNKDRIYISTCPVGTVIECQKDEQVLKSVNSADLVTPDGMPVVWLGRLKGHKDITRVYGPDLMWEICAISENKGYRNYFYGSTPEVLSGLRKRLLVCLPGLKIAGYFSPPFYPLTEEEDKKIINMINNCKADILWVGLGSPKQDIWMHEHRDAIGAPVIIGVGAAFDFLSGLKKQAPRWMQRSGLEWLFRLITEPKRLWKRYLLGNSLFMILIVRGLIRKVKEEFMKDKIILPAFVITLFFLMIFIIVYMKNQAAYMDNLDERVRFLMGKITSTSDFKKEKSMVSEADKAENKSLPQQLAIIRQDLSDLQAKYAAMADSQEKEGAKKKKKKGN
ncbi:MAG: WecB/TagA/CpsF family glycosyltransferase [Candidatus Omnitrophica bacterium]|nr:WecB/TagA/CpsF family glycosyltransferase [Candidatus Omnitrophota bacterium]